MSQYGDELGVDEMSTYSPIDELTLLMKWAVDEMAVDESPPHRTNIKNFNFAISVLFSVHKYIIVTLYYSMQVHW